MIAGGLWIYFRTDACYKMIPSQSVFPVVFVCTWIYANYKDPLCLPIGLAILLAYPSISTYITATRDFFI